MDELRAAKAPAATKLRDYWYARSELLAEQQVM
jgi:hypothetical protein